MCRSFAIFVFIILNFLAFENPFCFRQVFNISVNCCTVFLSWGTWIWKGRADVCDGEEDQKEIHHPECLNEVKAILRKKMF